MRTSLILMILLLSCGPDGVGEIEETDTNETETSTVTDEEPSSPDAGTQAASLPASHWMPTQPQRDPPRDPPR